MADESQVSYDSLITWMRYAPEEEVAEVLYKALTRMGKLDEFLEELDRRLAENSEH